MVRCHDSNFDKNTQKDESLRQRLAIAIRQHFVRLHRLPDHHFEVDPFDQTLDPPRAANASLSGCGLLTILSARKAGAGLPGPVNPGEYYNTEIPSINNIPFDGLTVGCVQTLLQDRNLRGVWS